MNNLIVANDRSSIQFANLGYKSPKDFEDWIAKELWVEDTELPTYGLFVDAHILMEHVFEQSNNSGKSIDMMETLLNLRFLR